MLTRRGFSEGELTTPRGDAFTERFLQQAGRELDRAYRLAGLLLSDRAEAEDAVQDALLRAWKAAASLRDPAGFQAWFDRILVNVCRDRLRRRRRISFISLDPIPPSRVADPFRELLNRDEAVRAMTVLTDDQRAVVVLHYWADLPLAAVAERVGWPLGTVKSRLHQALRRLQTQLEAVLAAEPGSS